MIKTDDDDKDGGWRAGKDTLGRDSVFQIVIPEPVTFHDASLICDTLSGEVSFLEVFCQFFVSFLSVFCQFYVRFWKFSGTSL